MNEPGEGERTRDRESDATVPPLGAGLDLADPNGPLARFYLRSSQAWALIVLTAIFALLGTRPLWHTDVWGHMKFGAWIINERALPQREPFSPFTDKEQPMLHAAWLSQVTYELLYRSGAAIAGGNHLRRVAGGVDALRFGHQIVALAMYAGMLVAIRRISGSLPLAVVCTIVLFVLTIGMTAVQRPQLFGYLMIAIVLLVLAKPLSRRTTWLGLPCVFILWANLHGSFVLGLALLGLSLFGRVLEGRSRWREVFHDVRVRRVFAATIVSILLVALANPHGPRLFLLVARFGSHPNLATVIEWQPLEFSLAKGGQWAYALVVVATILTQTFSPRWFTPTQWLWLLAFGLGPLWQQRLLSWWIIVAVCVLAPHWAAIGERVSWRWLHLRSVPSFRKTLIAMIPMGIALLLSIPAQWLLKRGPQPLELSLFRGTPWQLAWTLTGELPRPNPHPALTEHLGKHYPLGQFSGAVFCSETQGDFLSWALPPHLPVTATTQIHLYPPEYWTRFLRAANGAPGWAEFVRECGANLIVIEPDLHAGLAKALRSDPAWLVLVDEGGQRDTGIPEARHFIALRRQPLISQSAQSAKGE